MLSMEFIVQLIVLGSVVGVVAGLLGIGGGGIFVPVLTALFIANNISPDYVVHLALGTSMSTIVATSLSSMLAHHKNSNVMWSIVKRFTPFIIIAAFLTTFAVPYVNSQTLAIFFACFMAYISYKMFKGAKNTQQETSSPKPISLLPAFGIGSISTLVAIGGGSLSVPYLVGLGHNIKKAIGTAAAIGFPLALAGSIGYLLNGQTVMPGVEGINNSKWIVGFVHLPAVAILSVCGFITAPIGANLANKLPVLLLKRIFAVLLLGLSIKMLLNIF